MLLLTGFEPFGNFSANPSWDALKFALTEGLFRTQVEIAEIPCEYARAFKVFSAQVTRVNPDAAIAFGVHGRDAETIYIEQKARNRDGAPNADNAGERRSHAPIMPEAPATLRSTLPTAAIVDSLQAEGFSAELSDNAGNYLCNHLFFRGANAFALRFPFGFVHVPSVQGAGGVLTLERLAAAMTLIAHSLVDS